jgi:hypothetical protein
MILLAEMDPDLKVALLAFLGIATLFLQSVYQNWQAKKVAKELAETMAAAVAEKAAADEKAAAEKAAADKKHLEETAAKLATKTEQTARAITATVHEAVNGGGLGGKLDAILKWQVEHDAQDNLRYDGLVEEIQKLKGDKPRAGG